MRKFLFFISLLFVVLFNSCKKEIVHDYVMCKITMNDDLTSSYHFEGGGKHINDSAAILSWKQNYKSAMKFLSKKKTELTNKYSSNPSWQEQAEIDAVNNLLDQTYVLISISHDSDINMNDIKNIIKKDGYYGSELEKYAESHNITINVYEIN